MKDFEITSIEETPYSVQDPTETVEVKPEVTFVPEPKFVLPKGDMTYAFRKEDGTVEQHAMVERVMKKIQDLGLINRQLKRLTRVNELERAKTARVAKRFKKNKMAKASRKRNRGK
jgi:hypothetical protein